MKKIQPKLTLVGAGPGDPELITLKAVNALAYANVVLYDSLANKALLNHAPASVLKIFVGKRKGKHSLTQDEINKLIVKYALLFGNVVRLKGGDPFVFGRGYEEADYASLFGIPFEYIPGISSSTGVPGLSGIPVTHRGASESFWVITGTTKRGSVSKDVVLAAQTNATVVILMGLNKLEEIKNIYSKYGKNDTPVALIQNGSLPDEKIVSGTFKTIVDKAKKAKIASPAIIVIGEVVRLHQKFSIDKENLNFILN